MLAVNHYHCPPRLHSRDISQANAESGPQEHRRVTLADGRVILVMLCNDCRGPLFYCGEDQDYHHLGEVPPCWLLNEEPWLLSTSGFQCAEYGDIPEP